MPSVEFERRGAIAIITLNRPHVRNALDLAAMDALHDAARQAAADGIRAVILTGAGGEAFCAGGDLKSFKDLRSDEQGRQMSLKMQRALDALAGLPAPVICAINGYAMGGGSEVIVATDIRVAEEQVTISWRQLFFGVALGWGAAARLRRDVGARRAFRMVLMQETLSAVQAKELGIVDEIVPPGGAMARALEIAAQVAEMAPVGVRILKRQLLEDAGDMQREAALFAESWGSRDHHEAVSAFFEKRPPRFQGH